MYSQWVQSVVLRDSVTPVALNESQVQVFLFISIPKHSLSPVLVCLTLLSSAVGKLKVGIQEEKFTLPNMWTKSRAGVWDPQRRKRWLGKTIWEISEEEILKRLELALCCVLAVCLEGDQKLWGSSQRQESGLLSGTLSPPRISTYAGLGGLFCLCTALRSWAWVDFWVSRLLVPLEKVFIYTLLVHLSPKRPQVAVWEQLVGGCPSWN